MHRILRELPDPKRSAIQWAFKVLDAVDHLRRQGICWRPSIPPYAVDEHLEPTIGLGNDLCRRDPEIDQWYDIAHHLFGAVYALLYPYPLQEVAATDVRAAVRDCHNEQLTSVLSKFETCRRRRFVISKADLSHGFALNDGTTRRLLRVLTENGSDFTWRVIASMWADILLALDKNCSHGLQNGIGVIYYAHNNESDWLAVYCISEDSEHIVHDNYVFSIPDAQHSEVRAMFGIPAPSEEELYNSHIIATSGPGTYRAPE